MNRPHRVNTAARPAVVPGVEAALSRLSLTVQTALMRVERHRAAGRGGRA